MSDVWGFGQLVPLILLVQPFSVVWEHLMVARSVKEQQQEHEEDITAVAHKETSTTSLGSTTPEPSLQDFDVELQRPPPTLLQHLADCRPIKPSERNNHDPTIIEQILTRSRVFQIVIFLTQPVILIATVVTFKMDGRTLGTFGVFNWAVSIYMSALYLGVSWLVTFCLIPWDTIGRMPSSWRAPYTVGGQVEDGMGCA
jgi:hypothetical protein